MTRAALKYLPIPASPRPAPPHRRTRHITTANGFVGTLLSGAAGAVAGAATRSAINGSDFGDNVLAALPDVIGATIGNLVAGGIAQRQIDSNAVQTYVDDFVKTNPDATPTQIEEARQQGKILNDASKDFYRPKDLFESDTAYKARQDRAQSAVNKVSIARIDLAAAANGQVLTDAQRQEAIAASRKGYDSSTYDKTVAAATDKLDEIVVTARRDERLPVDDGNTAAVIARPIDLALNSLGSKAKAIGASIESRPYLKYGLQAAGVFVDAATLIYGGAAKFVVTQAVGAAQNSATGTVANLTADRFNDVGYDAETAASAAAGAAALVGLALNASNIVNSIKAIPSLINSIGTRLAGLGKVAAESAIIAPIHKNSLNYVGDTHVYAIRGPDGSLYKIGESARGVRVGDGASIRAEEQARVLFKETGDIYRTEIRQNFGGKADARAYETRYIQTYERLYGKRPPGNPLDR